MTWYVGVVGAFQHRRVEYELAGFGIPAFYPRLRRWVSHARSKIAAERPLLGQYVFVEIERPTGFVLVRSVRGLSGLLANVDGEPAAINASIVFDFRERYLRGEFDVTMRDIPVGALVRIIEGEFAEQLVTVTGVRRGRIMFATKSRRIAMTRRSNVSAA